MTETPRLRVLLTGAGGRIGPHLVPAFQRRFALSLLDRNPLPGYETIVADLADLAALEAAMTSIDVVVHLAATSDEAPFVEQLVPNNIIGLYNVYEAARRAGIRRMVFASTIQAVGFYPKDSTVRATDPPRPVTLYGATKAFGETLGRYYHDRHGLEVVNVRIGAFQPYDSPHLRRSGGFARRIWLSPKDAAELFCRAVETPGIGFVTVNATSVTEVEYLSLAEAGEILGYVPVDDVRQIDVEDDR